MLGSKFMEENAIKTQISYIEKEVGAISKQLSDFIISQDAKMTIMSSTFVRADVLSEIMKNLNKTMSDIANNYGCLSKQMDEHNNYLPMIKDIKKERDSVKFQIMSVAGKGLFWIVAAILGITAIFNK